MPEIITCCTLSELQPPGMCPTLCFRTKLPFSPGQAQGVAVAAVDLEAYVMAGLSADEGFKSSGIFPANI